MGIKKGYLFNEAREFFDFLCDVYSNCSNCPLNYAQGDKCLKYDYFEARNYAKAMSDDHHLFWCKKGELAKTIDKAFQAQADICAQIKKRCKSKGCKVIFNDTGTVWFTIIEEK